MRCKIAGVQFSKDRVCSSESSQLFQVLMKLVNVSNTKQFYPSSRANQRSLYQVSTTGSKVKTLMVIARYQSSSVGYGLVSPLTYALYNYQE